MADLADGMKNNPGGLLRKYAREGGRCVRDTVAATHRVPGGGRARTREADSREEEVNGGVLLEYPVAQQHNYDNNI